MPPPWTAVMAVRRSSVLRQWTVAVAADDGQECHGRPSLCAKRGQLRAGERLVSQADVVERRLYVGMP
jgi:hypothetical protein